MRQFAAGETVVRRDVFRGRVWSAHALRVLSDTPDALVTACGPGAETMVPTTYIESMLTGDDAVRKQCLPGLAAGHWQLGSVRRISVASRALAPALAALPKRPQETTLWALRRLAIAGARPRSFTHADPPDRP